MVEQINKEKYNGEDLVITWQVYCPTAFVLQNKLKFTVRVGL